MEEVEKQLIGKLILDFNNNEDFKEDCFLNIKENMFTGDNARIFKYLKSLFDKNKQLDLGILQEKIKHHLLNESYIFDLLEKGSFKNSIIQDFLEFYQRKKIEYTCREVMAKIKDFGHSNEDLIIELSKLENIKESEKDVVYSGIDLINEFDNTIDKDIELLSTGFNCDKQNILFERGDLIIIGARPAMGKTAYALNMFYNKIMKGEKGIFISLEMNNLQLTRRLLALSSRVETKYFKYKEMYEKIEVGSDLFEKITFGREIIKEISDRFRIMNPKKNNINYIRNEIKKINKDLKGIDFIMIDYLGLLSIDNKNKGDTEKMNEVSLWAKSLARELNCVTIGLAQINRGTEGRTDKRPIMSDLKQSGQLEQDASVVQLLYRDEYYNEKTEHKGILEVINCKNRDGKTYTELFNFNLEKQLILEV